MIRVLIVLSEVAAHPRIAWGLWRKLRDEAIVDAMIYGWHPMPPRGERERFESRS